MSATGIIWTVITIMIFAGLVALSIWLNRRDDEYFEQGPSLITDDERRTLQAGIGLTIGTLGGAGC